MNVDEDALYAMIGRLYVSWQLRITQATALEQQNRGLLQRIAELTPPPVEEPGG